jgi:hypothetical protein
MIEIIADWQRQQQIAMMIDRLPPDFFTRSLAQFT